jgi:WD40 repeat protein
MGDYRKAQLTLWSTQDYTSLLQWQDDSSSSYINCLTWNPMRANEFCLGGSKGIVHFCTIIEQTNDSSVRLQVINGQIPSSISEHTKMTCDVTSCNYLLSTNNLVLCATNCGFITCWNSRTNTCLVHWKADANEICYMSTIKNRLITGSSTGCLRLWNTESLEVNLGQTPASDTYV